MGNNINGKLYWSFIMANHTEEIRNSLKLKQTFVNDADVIIEDVVSKDVCRFERHYVDVDVNRL